jgi:predicted secreted Zn-dependent protease
MKLQCATSNLIYLVAISLLQTSVLAELVFDINYTSYKVQKPNNQPITYDQLIAQRQDCNKQSPFAACTIASHNYSVELVKSPLPCQVAKLDLNVKIRVLLPDFGDLLPSDQERLLGFSNKMSEHEAGHVDIYKTEFTKLYDKVSALTSDISCAQLKGQITHELKSGVDEIRVLQVSYDTRTRHGILQGTRFPVQ